MVAYSSCAENLIDVLLRAMQDWQSAVQTGLATPTNIGSLAVSAWETIEERGLVLFEFV